SAPYRRMYRLLSKGLIGDPCGVHILAPRLPVANCQAISINDGADDKMRERRKNHEVHDHLERTSAGYAHRVRKCTEANFVGLQPVESAREFQDRVVRHPRR